MRSAMKARTWSSVRPARTWRAISSRMSWAATAWEESTLSPLQVGHLIVSAMASMRSVFVRGWSRPLATTSVTTTISPMAAQDIRDEIARQVRAGRTDDQVRAFIAERIGEQYLLTPSAGGLGGLTWALPVVALVLGFGALGFAFAKCRREMAVAPDDVDRALVAAALAAEHASNAGPRATDAGLDDGGIDEGVGR